MEDRQSINPGRVKFTLDDGTVMFGTIERADSPTTVGTPINKNTLFNSNNENRYACTLPSEAFDAIVRESVVTVPVSAWSSEPNDEGYFTAEITVENMKKEYSPVFSPSISDALSSEDAESEFGYIKRMTTYDGYVVFKATSVPNVELSIRIKGV